MKYLRIAARIFITVRPSMTGLYHRKVTAAPEKIEARRFRLRDEGCSRRQQSPVRFTRARARDTRQSPSPRREYEVVYRERPAIHNAATVMGLVAGFARGAAAVQGPPLAENAV